MFSRACWLHTLHRVAHSNELKTSVRASTTWSSCDINRFQQPFFIDLTHRFWYLQQCIPGSDCLRRQREKLRGIPRIKHTVVHYNCCCCFRWTVQATFFGRHRICVWFSSLAQRYGNSRIRCMNEYRQILGDRDVCARHLYSHIVYINENFVGGEWCITLNASAIEEGKDRNAARQLFVCSAYCAILVQLSLFKVCCWEQQKRCDPNEKGWRTEARC